VCLKTKKIWQPCGGRLIRFYGPFLTFLRCPIRDTAFTDACFENPQQKGLMNSWMEDTWDARIQLKRNLTRAKWRVNGGLNFTVHEREKNPESLFCRVARFFTVQHTQTGKKYAKWPQNVPNIQYSRKLDKMAIKIPTSSAARPSKVYPKWDFWFEKYAIWQPCFL
jgi:hypothetical protein